jgi:two-component system autoinducer 1 sensor kinase/phosphatase LuxN
MDGFEKQVEVNAPKTVLLAEDEPMVRSVFSMNIRRMGLKVLPVADGVEAMEMFRLHKVDLAVLDCGMPRMNGFRVFTKMRRMNPDLPVLVISGDDDYSVSCRFGAQQPNEILVKPILFDALREAVSRWISVPENVR